MREHGCFASRQRASRLRFAPHCTPSEPHFRSGCCRPARRALASGHTRSRVQHRARRGKGRDRRRSSSTRWRHRRAASSRRTCRARHSEPQAVVTHAGTRWLALLGHPVAHSRSPAMMTAAFATLQLEAVYLACDVATDELHSAVCGLSALGALGANVTVPHKRAVLAHCAEVDREASVIGAGEYARPVRQGLSRVQYRRAGRHPRARRCGRADAQRVHSDSRFGRGGACRCLRCRVGGRLGGVRGRSELMIRQPS